MHARWIIRLRNPRGQHCCCIRTQADAACGCYARRVVTDRPRLIVGQSDPQHDRLLTLSQPRVAGRDSPRAAPRRHCRSSRHSMATARRPARYQQNETAVPHSHGCLLKTRGVRRAMWCVVLSAWCVALSSCGTSVCTLPLPTCVCCLRVCALPVFGLFVCGGAWSWIGCVRVVDG